ncbi:MAG: right-handed parallel beta-helix repeat-containing protein, partial [bacterium]
MKKLARLLFAAAICLLWAGSTYSEIRISGRLSGEWPPPDVQRPDTGYVVYVIDGPSWIPAGSSLIIHGKVKIQILWPPAIIVFGRMVTRASQDSPIFIEAVSNAEGFRFEGAAATPDTLRHIQVSQDKFPRNALTSNGRALYVQNCELWASWAAICAYSACVEIRDCGIYKRGGGEAAIYLVGADGSLIIQNRIDVQFPDMLPDFPSTNGIYINTIQDGEISNNTIDIRGPGFTTGIFGESICHSLSIENNSIYCQSENLVPRGIGLKHAVYCAISACTVTVDSRSPAQAVLWLYGSTVAEVMNSSLSLGGAGFGELVHQEGG